MSNSIMESYSKIEINHYVQIFVTLTLNSILNYLLVYVSHLSFKINCGSDAGTSQNTAPTNTDKNTAAIT